MAAQVSRIVANAAGIEAILKGTEGKVRTDLDARAQRIARRAGRGYVAEGWVGRRRYRATVRSTRPVALARSPLVAAMDAGR